MVEQVSVGMLRQQSALSDADRPVVVASSDETIRRLRPKVVGVYPDGYHEGDRRPVFVIQIERGEP